MHSDHVDDQNVELEPQRVRDLIEELVADVPPVLPDASSVRARVAQRARRRSISLAVVAVAAIALIPSIGAYSSNDERSTPSSVASTVPSDLSTDPEYQEFVKKLQEEARDLPTVLRSFTPPIMGYPKAALDEAILMILPTAPAESPVTRKIAPRGITINAVVPAGWNGTQWSYLEIRVWKNGKTVTSSDRAAVEDAVKSVSEIAFIIKIQAPAKPLSSSTVN